MKASLIHYQAAGYAAVCVSTMDEDRQVSAILRDFPQSNVFRIGATSGLIDVRNGRVVDERGSYPQAFGRVSQVNQAQPTVLVVLDYQHLIKNAQAYRALRDALPHVKSAGNLIVLLAPFWSLPAEIEHDIPVMDDALPSREELRDALNICTTSTGTELEESQVSACLDALTGCTLAEAENSAALVYSMTGAYTPSVLTDEKLKLVRQSGKLEISLPASIEHLGGLGTYRAYIESDVIPAIHDPELAVRGIMLVGVQGTGKSLLARITGSMLGFPVLRCDMSALKGSLVGASEANLRAALKLAEAVSPCVLYLDEIEKAVGGYASSAQTDGGVTLGMVGTLLTWLQEHRTRVLTIGTCNDYSKLPAELTRAGRFDERFFVDLPSRVEREEIALAIGRRLKVDSHAAVIADLTDSWTGAEIEELIRSAARRTKRNITRESLEAGAAEIKPLSRVRASEVSALRDWGRATLRLANTPESRPTQARKIVNPPVISGAVADEFSKGVA